MLVTGEAVTANYFDLLGMPLRSRPRVPRGREHRARRGAGRRAQPRARGSGSSAGAPTVVGETIKLSGLDYTVIGVAPAEFHRHAARHSHRVLGAGDDGRSAGVLGRAGDHGHRPRRTAAAARAARHAVAVRQGPAGRRPHHRRSARADRDDLRAAARRSIPTTNENVTASVVPVAEHSLPSDARRLRQGGERRAAGRGRPRAADRVRQRGQHAARARRGAPARARDPRGDRRQPRPPAPAAAGRSARARGGRRRARRADRVVGGPCAVGHWVRPCSRCRSASTSRSIAPCSPLRVAASVATAVLFGLAPAWSSSKPELVPALKASAETAGGAGVTLSGRAGRRPARAVARPARRRRAARRAACSRPSATDLGYDPRPVASLSFNLQMNGYDVDARRRRSAIARSGRFARLPGVTAVSTASRLPLAPDINMEGVHVPGIHRQAPTRTRQSTRSASAPTTSPPSACRSSPAAPSPTTTSRRSAAWRSSTRRWRGNTGPTARAVGRLIYTGRLQSPPYEIVGVARDHKVRSVGESPAALSCICRRARREASGSSCARPRRRRRRCRCCDRRCWQLEPDIVFTEDVLGRAGRGDDRGADAHRRDGARRVRRAGAAPRGGRRLRRRRLLGEPPHARGRHPHGARRGTRAACCA